MAWISLGQWVEFASQVCSLHFIFEFTLEHGVYEYLQLLRSAASELESDCADQGSTGSSSDSARPSSLRRRIEAYSAFAAASSETISPYPEQVFQLALASGHLSSH